MKKYIELDGCSFTAFEIINGERHDISNGWVSELHFTHLRPAKAGEAIRIEYSGGHTYGFEAEDCDFVYAVEYDDEAGTYVFNPPLGSMTWKSDKSGTNVGDIIYDVTGKHAFRIYDKELDKNKCVDIATGEYITIEDRELPFVMDTDIIPANSPWLSDGKFFLVYAPRRFPSVTAVARELNRKPNKEVHAFQTFEQAFKYGNDLDSDFGYTIVTLVDGKWHQAYGEKTFSNKEYDVFP